MQITDEAILRLMGREEFRAAFEAESNGKRSAEDMLQREKENCELLCGKINGQPGVLNQSDGYNCPLCMNRGYTLVPERCGSTYNTRMVICRCRTVRDAIARLDKSGLSDAVHKYTLEGYIAAEPWQKNILDKARSYLSDGGDAWFFIGGQSGCGKTHICTAVTVNLLKRGNNARYMLWREESSRLKSMANSAERDAAADVFRGADVLYIDDLFKTGRDRQTGEAAPREADINLAFEIINSRYMKNKITVISSEYSLEKITEFDEATGGRIKERCGDYHVSIAPDKNKNYRFKSVV